MKILGSRFSAISHTVLITISSDGGACLRASLAHPALSKCRLSAENMGSFRQRQTSALGALLTPK
jgi:hypothetical protein